MCHAAHSPLRTMSINSELNFTFYNDYMKDALSKINAENPENTNDKNMKMASATWSAMSYNKKNEAFNCAAMEGHLEAVKWLYNNEFPWSVYTCACAATKGHLEVLQWLYESHCPWDEKTCAYAAEGGHLNILRYAHEHRCPWDEGTCERAAEGGHLEMLMYAHEHGCPWNENISSAAAQGGHLEVIKYVHEKMASKKTE